MSEKKKINKKKVQEMTRAEYASYVQHQYRNDPQWVRTMIISKYDADQKDNSIS